MYVYDNANAPAVGDLIEVTGTIDEYYNLTELINVTNMTITSSGNPLPLPIELSTDEVSQEDYEGVLVKVSGDCTNTDLGFGEWELDDGSGPCRIDDLFHAFAPDQGVSYLVTGPLHYSFDYFKILPRDPNDIVIDLPAIFYGQSFREGDHYFKFKSLLGNQHRFKYGFGIWTDPFLGTGDIDGCRDDNGA